MLFVRWRIEKRSLIELESTKEKSFVWIVMDQAWRWQVPNLI